MIARPHPELLAGYGAVAGCGVVSSICGTAALGCGSISGNTAEGGCATSPCQISEPSQAELVTNGGMNPALHFGRSVERQISMLVLVANLGSTIFKFKLLETEADGEVLARRLRADRPGGLGVQDT